jgi:hypothetical protein
MLNKKGNEMTTKEAFEIVQKQADLKGQPFLETCISIKKFRRMAYEPKVVEAFDIVFGIGQQFFAEAE